jgi:hypothetical protein
MGSMIAVWQIEAFEPVEIQLVIKTVLTNKPSNILTEQFLFLTD